MIKIYLVAYGDYILVGDKDRWLKIIMSKIMSDWLINAMKINKAGLKTKNIWVWRVWEGVRWDSLGDLSGKCLAEGHW